MKTLINIFLFLTLFLIISCKNNKNSDCKICQNNNLSSYSNNFNLFNGSDNSTNINTADVKVNLGQPSVSVDGKTLTFKAKISNTNALNNAAWGVQGYVLLPDRVFIQQYSSSNSNIKLVLQHGGLPLPVGPGDASIKTGHLYFCTESLDRCESFEIDFKIKISDEVNIKELLTCRFNVGVFAFNQSPDQNMANNYDFWQNCKGNDTCDGSAAPASGASVNVDFPCVPEAFVPVDPICELINGICDKCTSLQQLCGGQIFVFEGPEDLAGIRLIASDQKGDKYDISAIKSKEGLFELTIPKDFKGLGGTFKHQIQMGRRVGANCRNTSVKVSIK